MSVDVSLATSADVSVQRRWAWMAQGYGLVVSAVLSYFLLGLVIQVSDSFGNLLAVQMPSLGEVVRDQFSQQAYLRPLLWAQIKLVYEWSGGDYYAWFRGLHVAQVGVLIALCVRVMRPAAAMELALVPLSLAVLVGAHTFVPLLREAHPINSYLTVAIACVAAASLAFQARPRWYTDALAVVLFIGATLTVESGILVWVVCAAAYLLGARGLSRSAVAMMTLCLVAYVGLRMLVLDVGTPSLAERASGFGFRQLEPAELVARFEGRAWTFYLYNVLSSLATVLFSEPKGGVWRFVFEATTRNVHPWSLVSVLSSTAATALVAWFLWTRRARLRLWTFDEDDRIVGVFVAVLAANAVISFPYTKNVIMSPAGVFFSLAVFAAARHWFQRAAGTRLLATVVIFAVLTCGWSYRVAGNHYNLRRTAAEERAVWVTVDTWLDRQRIVLAGPEAHALRDALRADALRNHPTPYQLEFAWTRWFDIDW